MNAKEELLIEIKCSPQIKCACIDHHREWDDIVQIVLKVGYSDQEYQKFLEELNFNYDSGYGGQVLFGTVWLEDGTWLSRGEYDGSEWWEHNILPEIPEECL
jgi:hypothetical protein